MDEDQEVIHDDEETVSQKLEELKTNNSEIQAEQVSMS